LAVWYFAGYIGNYQFQRLSNNTSYVKMIEDGGNLGKKVVMVHFKSLS
jgi:hypothetical protein